MIHALAPEPIDTAEPKFLPRTATAQRWHRPSDYIVTELDARGQPPPPPLKAILAAMQEVPAGAAQHVRTSQYPLELLQALTRRGFNARACVRPDGTWQMIVISPVR